MSKLSEVNFYPLIHGLKGKTHGLKDKTLLFEDHTFSSCGLV